MIEIDVTEHDFINLVGKIREHEVDSLVIEAMDDIAGQIRDVDRVFAPKRTGTLVRNIDKGDVHRTGPDTFETRVGVRQRAHHGLWVEHGTGIFGPTASPIRPVAGQFLVFQGRNGLVVTRYVKGQRAQKFLERAYDVVTSTYVPARLEKLAHDMGNLG